MIFLVGVPSALCNGAVGWISELRLLTKGGVPLNWLDSFDYLASNWPLPIGGLLIALCAGWGLPREEEEEEFETGEAVRRYVDFHLWNSVIRYVSPAAVLAKVPTSVLSRSRARPGGTRPRALIALVNDRERQAQGGRR